MATQLQLRGDVALNWSTANPILADREIGIETISRAYKIGDGITPWNSLPYRDLSGSFDTLLVNVTSDPPPPSEGKLMLYTKSIAGRLMPKWVGPSGLDTAFQPAIFSNGIQIISPSTTTAFSTFGTALPTAVGTVSHPAIAVGGQRVQTRRGIVTSAATANSAAELRVATYQCYRGDNTGGAALGGFFLVTRFAVSSVTLNQRVAVGLFSSIAATAVTQNPSALLNCVFVGWDSADTNLQLMCNDGIGSCTKINLGSSFPANTPDAVYEVALFCPPMGSSINYLIKRLDVPAAVSGELTTDIPALSQLLAWHIYANNGGTAASVVIELMRMYLETDY